MMRTMTMGHMNPQNYTYIQQPQQQQQIPLNHLNIHHGKRPIAPAPVQNILSQNNNNQNQMIIKNKKMNYAQVQQYHGTQPASVARRNARERNRVKQVNNGFSVLRQRIPQNVIAEFSNGGRGASKKLSKVDTLRMAVSYIKRLQLQLDSDHDSSSDLSTISSQSSSSYDLGSPENNFFLPACSEASSSPTPSYESETSIHNNIYAQHEQYDYGPIFNDTHTTEEDLLLDTITMWQQQQ